MASPDRSLADETTAPPDMTDTELAQEKAHFASVQRALLYYRTDATGRLRAARKAFEGMSKTQQARLPNLIRKLRSLGDAVDVNARFISELAADMDIFLNTTALPPSTDRAATPAPTPVSEGEVSRVYTTLKQFYRDWSAEGAGERAACYTPLLDKLDALLGSAAPRSVSVQLCCQRLSARRRTGPVMMGLYQASTSVCLVIGMLSHPLHRSLAWECAARGYACQGNEFSAYMLVASNYILNKAGGTHRTRLFPFAHRLSNNYHAADPLLSVTVPDVDTFGLPPGTPFSMAAGDFLEVYQEPASLDCVLSCFFLDTASNVVTYIERLYEILRPGGHLLNLGPLLYHFEDDLTMPSIELSYTELRDVMCSCGFVIEEERYPLPTTYIGDPAAMMQTTYNCVFFHARKPHAHEYQTATRSSEAAAAVTDNSGPAAKSSKGDEAKP